MSTYHNPILSGFYPDPSICRVNDDYYLVNSTFAYYPGIPVFHSRDLVHWQQIGHVLTRSSQIDLSGLKQSQGIYAPTIRYHKGIFYVITTNIGKCGNFYVMAEHPEGPWSDPVVIDAEGIDPTIFFDEDKAYYLGTREKKPEVSRYYGDNEIWLQELDLEKGKLIGEKYVLWEGALKDAVWPEGPHLYKRKGYYYLMIAEGGTGYQHAITIARSRSLKEGYEGNPANPILTHRHLGKHAAITCTGHGDLVQAQDGSWWMVLLGCRPYGGCYSNMGRETFLVPVEWEDEWPVVNPGKGSVEEYMKAPGLAEDKLHQEAACDHFETEELGGQWMTLRNPDEDMYSLTRKRGCLSIKLRPEMITESRNASFIGRRQQHKSFIVRTSLNFKPFNEKETAGLALFQNENYQIRVERGLFKTGEGIQIIRREAGKEEVLAGALYNKERIYIKIAAWEQEAAFYYGEDEKCSSTLIEGIDTRLLSPEMAGGFTGTSIGMFASSNGIKSSNYAEFNWFEYNENKEYGGR